MMRQDDTVFSQKKANIISIICAVIWLSKGRVAGLEDSLTRWRAYVPKKPFIKGHRVFRVGALCYLILLFIMVGIVGGVVGGHANGQSAISSVALDTPIIDTATSIIPTPPPSPTPAPPTPTPTPASPTPTPTPVP